MAKVKQFEKVLSILKSADGMGVTKEEITKTLGNDIAPNRISTYIWEIKTKAGVPVEAIKAGRNVVGFRIGSAPEVADNVSPDGKDVNENGDSSSDSGRDNSGN